MTWRNLLILTLIASWCLGNTDCAGPKPRWQPQIFYHDSGEQLIGRGNAVISCRDPRFDEYISIHKSEPRKAQTEFNRIINLCERWKPGAAAHLEVLNFALEADHVE